MGTSRLGDVELTYQLRERGERVVLVHASAFASWYDPLIEQLTAYSTLRYRRRLRKSDSGVYRALTVAEDAGTCVSVMDHVGWDAAHIVGHSYGALVALQLVTENPGRVGSVALLEPAIRGVASSEQIIVALQPVIAAYRSGDKAAAVDGFLRHVCGDGYRGVLDRMVPHAFDDALEEADLFFQSELPAVQQWSFGAAESERITQPVLNVLGAESAPRFVEGSELLQSWFPRAERLSVPKAGHLLMVQNPTAVARGLKDFFSRHPIDQVGSALRRRSL